MNLKEAYSILEIPQSASPEEAKKKYRKLTKEYHPDINKDPGAEEKFKKINEAYQYISSGKGTSKDVFSQSGGREPFNPFNPFGKQAVRSIEHINLNTTISFKESILGCQKELKFHHKTKCKQCDGEGQITLSNGCSKCGGRGQVVTQHGNMIFTQSCSDCHGRVQVDICKVCHQQGVVDAEASITVSIPAGVKNSNVLRLGGIGNFAGSFGPLEQYTDVHLYLNVTPEPGLSLDGNTVVSNISISLLEALRGCKKNVNTIMGSKEIEIKPKFKNKDEVTLPNLGVGGSGTQKVIVNVEYPEDINILIRALSPSTEGKN